jgi:hypothetical protein
MASIFTMPFFLEYLLQLNTCLSYSFCSALYTLTVCYGLMWKSLNFCLKFICTDFYVLYLPGQRVHFNLWPPIMTFSSVCFPRTLKKLLFHHHPRRRIFFYSALEGMVTFQDTEYTDDYKIQIYFLEFNLVREKEIHCKD